MRLVQPDLVLEAVSVDELSLQATGSLNPGGGERWQPPWVPSRCQCCWRARPEGTAESGRSAAGSPHPGPGRGSPGPPVQRRERAGLCWVLTRHMRQLFLHITWNPFQNLTEAVALSSNVPSYTCEFAFNLGVPEMCSPPEPTHGPQGGNHCTELGAGTVSGSLLNHCCPATDLAHGGVYQCQLKRGPALTVTA